MKRLFFRKQIKRQFFSQNRDALLCEGIDGERCPIGSTSYADLVLMMHLGYRFYVPRKMYRHRQPGIFEQKVWHYMFLDEEIDVCRPDRSKTRLGSVLACAGDFVESLMAFFVGSFVMSAFLGGCMALLYVLLCINPGFPYTFEGLLKFAWLPMLIGAYVPTCVSIARLAEQVRASSSLKESAGDWYGGDAYEGK